MKFQVMHIHVSNNNIEQKAMQKCWTFVPDVISKMKLKPDISESKYYHKLLQKAKICKYTDRDKNGYILPNPVKHGSKAHIM